MDDVFNSVADDEVRGLTQRLSRAFDNSREIQERTAQRWNLPTLANDNKDWAIARSLALADGLNRTRARPVSSGGGNSGRGSSSGSGRGGGGSDPLGRTQTTIPRTAPASRQMSSTQRAMQILPYLLGKNGFNNLIERGLINVARDYFGKPTITPSTTLADWIGKNFVDTPEGRTIYNDPQRGLVDVTDGTFTDQMGNLDGQDWMSWVNNQQPQYPTFTDEWAEDPQPQYPTFTDEWAGDPTPTEQPNPDDGYIDYDLFG